jgi:hypothetical protein
MDRHLSIVNPRSSIHNRALRRIHLLSTVWFIGCIGYILVLKLREVGFQWWQIFSLAGSSALVVFLLVSLYLFAVYRGLGEAQHIEIEHPLTTSSYYMTLYVAAPLLGGLAGILAGILAGTLDKVGVTEAARFLQGVALGSLGTTFVIWVVVDPVAGVLEMVLPASRRHRTERLALAEAQRRARQEKREHLLAEAYVREERERQQWQEKLQSQAERLAALLACDAESFARAEQEAVDLGAQAWRLGGLSCMRQLHDMTIQAVRDRRQKTEDGRRMTEDSAVLGSTAPRLRGGDPALARGQAPPAQAGVRRTKAGIAAVRPPSSEPPDYLSYWWDGIGGWRKPPLG